MDIVGTLSSYITVMSPPETMQLVFIGWRSQVEFLSASDLWSKASCVCHRCDAMKRCICAEKCEHRHARCCGQTEAAVSIGTGDSAHIRVAVGKQGRAFWGLAPGQERNLIACVNT